MLFVFATALMLGISLFIETSSWWIRANASAGNFGHYISRSNIYLYSARLFSLGFAILLAIQIESLYPPFLITLSLSVSFFFSCILQLLLLSVPTAREKIMRVIMRLMFLGEGRPVSAEISDLKFAFDWSLFFSAFFSSSIFAAGISIPSFLSSIFLDNRLVISNLGQLINAFGAIIILFVVDQKLFKALDRGDLSVALVSYTHARVASCAFMAVVFLIICLILYRA